MPTIRSNLSVPLSLISKISAENDEAEKMDESEKRPETAFRPICLKCGVFGAQDGSGYAEFGNTRVLAQITGPDGDGKWEENYAKITVSVKGVEQEAELRAQLASAISAVIFAKKYPGKVIDVEVTVLCDDGGVLSTALTAVTLAISHSGIENMGLMGSVHVGVRKNGSLVTDPDAQEGKDLLGGLTMAFVPNLSQTTCVDVYGRLEIQNFSKILEFARQRTISIVPAVHKAILNSVKERN